jgi:hypothetical protein
MCVYTLCVYVRIHSDMRSFPKPVKKHACMYVYQVLTYWAVRASHQPMTSGRAAYTDGMTSRMHACMHSASQCTPRREQRERREQRAREQRASGTSMGGIADEASRKPCVGVPSWKMQDVGCNNLYQSVNADFAHISRDA